MKTVVVVVWVLVVTYQIGTVGTYGYGVARDSVVIDDIADRESCMALGASLTGASSAAKTAKCTSYRKVVVVEK